MKNNLRICLSLLIISGLFLIPGVGCKKIFKDPSAHVTTYAVGTITQTSAVCSGSVEVASAHITERGICWNTLPNPYIANYTFIDTSGNEFGSFSVTLTGLWPNTKYYANAYASNTNNVTGYGKEVSFTTLQVPGETVTDIDGNVYHTVKIGSQTWMFENLKVTRYRNGDAIPMVTGDWGSLNSGAYCWFGNDHDNYAPHYGALYNWYALSDSRHICPEGWHIPSNTEWNTLIGNLGGVDVAGAKLKERGYMHWVSPDWQLDYESDNSSGFTALPGGCRQLTSDYPFSEIHYSGNWWSVEGLDFVLKRENSRAELSNTYSKTFGLSVRCIKD